jgi:hypothetical protein
MDTGERILKDYRNAGEDQRLDLFLAYRDLRDRFREIEREESSAGSLRESPASDALTVPGAAAVYEKPAHEGLIQAIRSLCS